MTRKESLADLIAKVEAGKWDRQYPRQGMAGLRSAERLRNARRAYSGSLDAAKDLHEAVLPDVAFKMQRGRDAFGVSVAHMPVCLSPDPARAWLLAILRALHSMAGAEA